MTKIQDLYKKNQKKKNYQRNYNKKIEDYDRALDAIVFGKSRSKKSKRVKKIILLKLNGFIQKV